MDKPRNISGRKRVIRILVIIGLVSAIVLVSIAVSKLKPAAPTVEAGTLYPDTVKRGEMVIEVRGFTDNRGTAKHNLVLSQHRAESVMNYLQEHGVANSLTAKGFGKENPIADNKTKEGQLTNRRVTLRIVGGP